MIAMIFRAAALVLPLPGQPVQMADTDTLTVKFLTTVDANVSAGAAPALRLFTTEQTPVEIMENEAWTFDAAAQQWSCVLTLPTTAPQVMLARVMRTGFTSEWFHVVRAAKDVWPETPAEAVARLGVKVTGVAADAKRHTDEEAVNAAVFFSHYVKRMDAQDFGYDGVGVWLNWDVDPQPIHLPDNVSVIRVEPDGFPDEDGIGYGYGRIPRIRPTSGLRYLDINSTNWPAQVYYDSRVFLAYDEERSDNARALADDVITLMSHRGGSLSLIIKGLAPIVVNGNLQYLPSATEIATDLYNAGVELEDPMLPIFLADQWISVGTNLSDLSSLGFIPVMTLDLGDTYVEYVPGAGDLAGYCYLYNQLQPHFTSVDAIPSFPDVYYDNANLLTPLLFQGGLFNLTTFRGTIYIQDA